MEPKVTTSTFKTEAQAIEQILTFLGLSEQEGPLDTDLKQWWDSSDELGLRVPIRRFSGAHPMIAGLRADPLVQSHRPTFLGLRGGELGENARFDGHELFDVWECPIGPWSYSWIGPGEPQHSEALGKKATSLFNIQCVRSVHPAEIRPYDWSRLATTHEHLFEQSLAVVFNDGTYWALAKVGEWTAGVGPTWLGAGHCIARTEDYKPRPSLKPDDAAKVFFAKSAALTQWYEWQCQFGLDGPTWGRLPTVALTCDPVGAQAALRLRDIPPGSSRREALRHWVCEHWRKAHDPVDPKIHIWPFLRGATEFSFRGLRCRLEPSPYDLKKAAEFQACAHVEQAQRKEVGRVRRARRNAQARHR